MAWRETPGAWAAGLAALMLSCGGCGAPDVHVVVTFMDAQGVHPGDPVIYNGVRAGQVTAVGLETTGRARIELSIPRRYRDTLYLEADYTIGRPGGVGSSGARQVTVSDRPGQRTPLREGAVIAGRNPLLQLLLSGARNLAIATWDEARAAGRQIADGLSLTDHGDRLDDDMRRFCDGALESAERAALVERLRRGAEEYRDDLVRGGRADEAQVFWSRFEVWLRDAARVLRQPAVQ